ncbi:invasin domain 3-containing protein, partial [Yersinia enterocolitica]
MTPVVVPTNSSITAADTHLSADGTATTTLTLTLKDVNGLPLTGQSGSLDITPNTLTSAGTAPQIGTVTEVSPGVYEVTVTAGTQTGDL